MISDQSEQILSSTHDVMQIVCGVTSFARNYDVSNTFHSHPLFPNPAHSPTISTDLCLQNCIPIIHIIEMWKFVGPILRYHILCMT